MIIEINLIKKNFILSTIGCLEDKYTFIETIGSGTWGKVQICKENKTGALRAIKQIPKRFIEDMNRYRQEILIMKKLDHPNIVRLYNTFEDDRHIFLVMELCRGGELFDRIANGAFGETHAAQIMKQVLSAVWHCHMHGIAHRDLKPENFLFCTEFPYSPIKLIDFGLASRFDPSSPKMTTPAGTPYYVAPEVLEGGHYSELVDEWAAGVLMYILLCGYPPFNGRNDREIMRKVSKGFFSFPEKDWKDISDEAKDLLRLLICKDVKTRLTAEQALNHPWIKQMAPHSKTIPTQHDAILDRFRRFKQLGKLHKAVMTILAQQMEDEDIGALRDAFQYMDVDGSGMLSLDVIRNTVVQWSGSVPADFEELISCVNTDGDGKIKYTEFVAATLDRGHMQSETYCRRAFSVLDRENHGDISAKELCMALGSTQPVNQCLIE
eukprot:GHVL01008951.1.p1 GENE.GHVL01008951.1~~GHVL01008951.1.p1  ORF type:complete len:437 (+),score=80.77 GHVL01008951.1:607-1917(+)